MSKRLSRNDLIRYNKVLSKTSSEIIDGLIEEATKNRVYAEILEDVVKQFSQSKMTRHEAMQFIVKWNSYKDDEDVEPETVIKDLGLENLEENFNEIWKEYQNMSTDMTIRLMIQGVKK